MEADVAFVEAQAADSDASDRSAATTNRSHWDELP